jgi:hypothetical protein
LLITTKPGIDHIAPATWSPYQPPETLNEYAARFPHMGGVKIGPELMRAASGVPPTQCIVEVGVWLGGGTAHLALGAHPQTPIYCFDWFRCWGEDARKAHAFGVNFENGGDTLPWLKAALTPFDRNIIYKRVELRTLLPVEEPPIAIYVDDASKSPLLWKRAMDVFKPRFIPGTWLYLMDYYFFERAGKSFTAQRDYMNAHKDEFTLIRGHIGETSCAVFRFNGGPNNAPK